MAVQWVAEWRVNPGRRGDAMAVFSEYKQNAKRLGSHEPAGVRGQHGR